MNFTLLVRRILSSVLIIWAVASLTFFMIHLLPGDPVENLLGEHASELDKENIKKQLGLNEPLPKQYLQFINSSLHLDWGTSFYSKKSVFEEIRQVLPITVYIATLSVGLSFVFSLIFSSFISLYSRTIQNLVLSFLGLGVSLPSFFIAPVLVYFFSIQLKLLPVQDNNSFRGYILPICSLSLGLFSTLSLFLLNSFQEIQKQNFVQVLKAKGLHPYKIQYIHLLKNILPLMVNVVGLQLGALLSGALVVESIFDLPGMGSLLYQSVQSRNYPVVQYCILISALLYIFIQILVDILQYTLNPRAKL